MVRGRHIGLSLQGILQRNHGDLVIGRCPKFVRGGLVVGSGQTHRSAPTEG